MIIYYSLGFIVSITLIWYDFEGFLSILPIVFAIAEFIKLKNGVVYFSRSIFCEPKVIVLGCNELYELLVSSASILADLS